MPQNFPFLVMMILSVFLSVWVTFWHVHILITVTVDTKAPLTRATFPWQVYSSIFIARVDDQQVSFTIFHWQGFLVHVDDQQVSLDKFRLLKIVCNILATISLLSVYTSKFLTWQFFLVKEKLARQIFLDKENVSTFPHLHEQFSEFFVVKEKLLV